MVGLRLQINLEFQQVQVPFAFSLEVGEPMAGTDFFIRPASGTSSSDWLRLPNADISVSISRRITRTVLHGGEGDDLDMQLREIDIEIEDDDTGNKQKYQIVGEYESDIENKKLSIISPLARGLIGKSQGDNVEINSPKGTKSYTIISVKYI